MADVYPGRGKQVSEQPTAADDLPMEAIAAESIGANVRRLRHEREWTLRDLSERSGIAFSYIHSIESGKQCNPTIRHLLNLSRALGVSVVELLQRDDRTEPQRCQSGSHEAETELVLTNDERKQLLDIAYRAFWKRHPVYNSAGDRIMSEQHERALRNDLYTLSPPTMEAMLEAVAKRVWRAAIEAARNTGEES